VSLSVGLSTHSPCYHSAIPVETIGDCYVAVCGVPTKNDLHALVMSKFAIDCLNKMGKLVQELEACLGPGTESLALRVGLHSGPVTAGVLR